MESLTTFVKQSSALDLFVVMLIIFIALILILVGILIVISSRRRKPIYFFLIITLLPLLLGLLGTYLIYIRIEKDIALLPNASAEGVAEARQAAWITTYIGTFGTAIPGLIGVTGLILKKEKQDLIDR
jgi:hypothetical protein